MGFLHVQIRFSDLMPALIEVAVVRVVDRVGRFELYAGALQGPEIQRMRFNAGSG
jgi:hypothetical protein